MKKDQQQAHDLGRRNFMRSSVVAGLGAVSVASLPISATAAEEVKAEAGVDRGYQLTSHVLDYYKTLAG